MKILEEFWYGNIDPAEYDSNASKEYKEVLRLISCNEEKLAGNNDGRTERTVFTIHGCRARISGHGRVPTVPEQLQARCQDDAGSH